MPTLFISYKRGTSAFAPLMDRLHAENYSLWYDKDDIHAGENWREAINRGVDASDAVIVGLTPAAVLPRCRAGGCGRLRDRNQEPCHVYLR